MGISFGQGQHLFQFSEPITINAWAPPARAGLYAVLVPDQRITPRPFRVIYFGESGNMDERGFNTHHARASWMLEAAAAGQALYIATYAMPNSTPEQRRQVEAFLCSTYSPSCNG